MKRKTKSIIKNLPPLEVYLNEVEDLYNLLKDEFKKVIIETDDYEMSDLEELKNIQAEHIHHLVLTGRTSFESSVSINLLESSAHLYVDPDTTQNMGVLSRIEDTLNKCHRKIARIFVNPIIVGIIGALVFIIPALILLEFGEGLIRLSILPILALAIWYYVWSIQFGAKSYSTIILSKRRERKNFFVRNKDQIFVAIIASIIGALLSAIVMLLLVR